MPGPILRSAQDDSPVKEHDMQARTLLFTFGALAAAAPAAAQSLTGAGATFPNPIYSKWFDAYNKKTGVQINYQSIGSGGGIKQFSEGTVDFGATDGPIIADIFLGKVTKWNDRRMVAANPGAKLPAADIIVVHRSDGSGTSYIF